MGIFIHMCISKAVTAQEWEAVYEETLRLVEAFPLAERRMVNCKGIETMCLAPTVERDVELGRWSEKRIRRGWMANGDYETMHCAEEYCLWRDTVGNDIVPDAGDALWGLIPWTLDIGEGREDPRSKRIFKIWGGKTQGEPYHMYLLAIACLIEDRLGERAFVYGDITRGQCKKAVELANRHLEKMIELPARCDLVRFKERVSRLDMSARDQLRVFEEFYLGTKNAEFGEYMRTAYSTEVLDEYWRYEFGESYYSNGRVAEKTMNYLLWGFPLNKLCGLINFNDKENVPHYADFVKLIMDAKLHIKDKNCNDILKIDQEESTPYSIYTLFAQIMFRGAENKKVDRYIPIEEIKRDLAEGLGNRCDVETIIEEYLQKESEEQEITISEGTTSEDLKELCNQDASETFSQLMERNRQSIIEERKKYDVTEFEHFLYYECGDTIKPGLLGSLKKSYEFYSSLTKEDWYKELMVQSPNKRCSWLAEQNRSIMIRDCDWNKIFTDIETNEESFSRYYPMVRVILNSTNMIDLIKAIVLNDALYAYCKENF